MTVALGALLGVLLGAWLAVLWGLRRARDGAPVALLLVLALVSAAYPLAAGLWGWPAPGSLAREAGVVESTADGVVLAATAAVVAAAVVALLVRSRASRRLEAWASPSDG